MHTTSWLAGEGNLTWRDRFIEDTETQSPRRRPPLRGGSARDARRKHEATENEPASRFRRASRAPVRPAEPAGATRWTRCVRLLESRIQRVQSVSSVQSVDENVISIAA